MIGGLTGNEWADLSHYVDERLPVWVPIYRSDIDQPSGNGSKAYYDIVGFGAIVFTARARSTPNGSLGPAWRRRGVDR